jgi:hypothetical protein
VSKRRRSHGDARRSTDLSRDVTVDSRHRRTPSDALEFVFKLEGSLVDVEVFELASALEAMSLAVRESHRVLYREDPPVRVAVRPVMRGSYVIRYALSYGSAALGEFAPHFCEQVADRGVVVARPVGPPAEFPDSILEKARRFENAPCVFVVLLSPPSVQPGARDEQAPSGGDSHYRV